MFDNVIVGCGFAGCVMAERIANVSGKSVLIIEKRNHIGGNCYDHYDSDGVLVHKYGPHIFHTSNQKVFEYLSGFTSWINYQHKVLALIHGQYLPVPFNLNSLRMAFPESLSNKLEQKLVQTYGYGKKIPILELRDSKDTDLCILANYIYDNMFLNYTTKQWNCPPDKISPEVTARVPVSISRDDRYFDDQYQVIPAHGYTRIFEKMLDHPNIKLLTNCDYESVVKLDHKTKNISLFGTPFEGKLIFTGQIDQLFNFKFGELPYRSLQFEFENLKIPQYQQLTTINFPNDYDFTRITEFKHLTGQNINSTTIVREYPQDYDRNDPMKNIPYYPVFTAETRENYERYREYHKKFKNIILVGRLAEYRYYDMDDVVDRALQVYDSNF